MVFLCRLVSFSLQTVVFEIPPINKQIHALKKQCAAFMYMRELAWQNVMSDQANYLTEKIIEINKQLQVLEMRAAFKLLAPAPIQQPEKLLEDSAI